MNMGPANVKLNPVGAAACIAIGLCVVIYIFGLPDWFQQEQKVSLKELLSVSIELAKRGGEQVRSIRHKNTLAGKVKGKTDEGAKEMLTAGDTESHRAIVYGLAKTFPGLQIISEEDRELRPVSFKSIPDVNSKNEEVNRIITNDLSVPFNKITVWVDPLDATQEYTEDLRQYVTVMICVAVNGQPTIGIIHNPFEESIGTVWAWVGKGHSGNIKAAPHKSRKDPKEDPYRIIVSRSHSGKVDSVIKGSLGNNTVIIPAGGAGYKSLQVLQGKADAYVHITKIKKWDICAGNAILNAFNGKMTTLEGGFIDYKYSTREHAVNDEGLLTTLYDHFQYLDKMSEQMKELKKQR